MLFFNAGVSGKRLLKMKKTLSNNSNKNKKKRKRVKEQNRTKIHKQQKDIYRERKSERK